MNHRARGGHGEETKGAYPILQDRLRLEAVSGHRSSVAVTVPWLNITGTLDIAATSGSKFTINITSLTLASGSGLAPGFMRGQTCSFPIATALGGISGFSADKFFVDTSGFLNDPANLGGFTISQVGNTSC